MSKLFEQVSKHQLSSSMDSSFEIEKCYVEIAGLKEQLSSIGIEHLLKVRQLEEEVKRAQDEVETVGGIRQILENQIEGMARDLQDQYRHNREIEEEMIRWREASSVDGSQSNRRERKEGSEWAGSEYKGQINTNSQGSQEQLILMSQKVQLLELKNESLVEQITDLRQELELSKFKQTEDNNRYQRRIHELSSNIERLSMEGDSLTIIRNQNNILHKELELKIYEVQELTHKLLQNQEQQEMMQEKNQVKQSQDNRLHNLNKEDIKEYLQEAILQIEDLRKENELLKSEIPNEKNLKSLKAELIGIKAEYSNALRENNLLIEENAKVQKLKNQMAVELERLKRGQTSKKQKAYITICQQKNQMEIELMNTYQQIEKLNNLLMRKQNQIQQLLAGMPTNSSSGNAGMGLGMGNVGKKKDIFVNEGYGVKLVMQNAEQLNHGHWESIENKIKFLKNQNEALKNRRGNAVHHR